MNNIILKGITGEEYVDCMLKNLKVKYYNDIYLKSKSGIVCQVDFIIVTDSALFCIEVKNYNRCYIKGEENYVWWDVKYNGASTKIYNPIKQNDKHIMILRDCLDFNNLPVYNIVVFVGGCTLSIKRPSDEKILLLDLASLWSKLIDLTATHSHILSDEELGNIIGTLDTFNNDVYNLSIEHKKFISKSRT